MGGLGDESPVLLNSGGEEEEEPTSPVSERSERLGGVSPVSPWFSKGNDTDLVLRSCDDFDFHVHSSIILLASPSFYQLTHQPDEDRVIPVVENGKNLNILLTLVYPIANPVWESLDGFSSVLESAQKYRMESAVQALAWMMISPRLNGETFLPSFVEIDPVRVFAIARGAGLDAEGDLAARATLKVSLKKGPPSPEVDKMPTKYYRELMAMRGSKFKNRIGSVTKRRASSDSASTYAQSSYATSVMGH